MLYNAQQNIAFSSIHDSYWTRAAEVAQLNYNIRKAFCDLYQHDYIEHLLELQQEREYFKVIEKWSAMLTQHYTGINNSSLF